MCRKRYMQGWCVLSFGLGVIVGHCLESWFLCCCGGCALILLGLWVMKQR